MDQREQELQRFRDAVDRKSEQAREAAESTHASPAGGTAGGDDAVQGDESSLTERGRPQDTYDIRAKNAGKGKKTADKWNQ